MKIYSKMPISDFQKKFQKISIFDLQKRRVISGQISCYIQNDMTFFNPKKTTQNFSTAYDMSFSLSDDRFSLYKLTCHFCKKKNSKTTCHLQSSSTSELGRFDPFFSSFDPFFNSFDPFFDPTHFSIICIPKSMIPNPEVLKKQLPNDF